MTEAYWISLYRAVHDPERLAAYAALATPAIAAAGGVFLARGTAAAAWESGQRERTVLIRFPDLASAVAAHDSDAYQEALRVLGDAVDRDLRIVEGLDSA